MLGLLAWLGSVKAATFVGLMSGRGEKQFQPNQLASRAETAQAVSNLQQMIAY
ncbi:S-layer homology domain-containing protein [Paenibacillus sp. 1_12]|uniref:S-layer homology domain-containing protein n=1 Tax=Paenibacillus sp. 1_12 TaxID=1566278 RepID=UPI001160B22E|nr:S-layer homology domain-containing protein [Paenibacillus sp. 1_12]